MFTKRTALILIAIALITKATALGTTWVADFTSDPPESVVGIDENMVVTYADAANPPSGTKTWVVGDPPGYANVPDGWLTQGSIAGIPTTLKVFNQVGDSLGGRFRLTTSQSFSMDATAGVSFAWRARYGNYPIGRGPIQITARTPANVKYGAYLRVQNGVTAQIQNNGGTLLTNISALTIPNVADDAYHQWNASIIVLGDGLAHWKLWVDGTQLLFAGTDGAHQVDPAGGTNLQQFSFKTAVSNYSNPVATENPDMPFISIGEVQNNTFDQWDFEFDCVAYRDDGIVDTFSCGGQAPVCDSAVNPAIPQTVTSLKNGTPSPASINYTFTNVGGAPVSYTVAETDQNGDPQNHSWLSLDKSGGGPLGAEASDVVVASIIDTNLPHGVHTAYITFTDSCNPVEKHTRRIDLNITDCASTVQPSDEIARSVMSGSAGPVQSAVFTLINTGTSGLTYSVTKEGDCAWLALDKSTLGPLNNGQSESVTASINPTGVSVGSHTCTLRFANTRPDCTNALPDILRKVTLSVWERGGAHQQINAEFTDFTGSDATSSTPFVACDPADLLPRPFRVIEASLNVANIDPGWLTQGTISGVPTTARFWNVPDGRVGRARFEAKQGFDERYDATKGISVAYRLKVGNYAINRGPMQILFTAAPGPLSTDTGATDIPDSQMFGFFIMIRNGTDITILRGGGAVFAGINTLVLPQNIANDYHQWTATLCYNPDDQRAYCNLWIDGVKLLFSGSNADGSAGSPVGPGGQVFSFRMPANGGGTNPHVSLGDIGNSPLPDIWDIEFDWVRIAALNVAGCPFWDGEGCLDKPCPIPFADADEDGDVDLGDFAKFQLCYTGSNPQGPFDKDRCRCFDRNQSQSVDDFDFQRFAECSTRAGVSWVPSVDCP